MHGNDNAARSIAAEPLKIQGRIVALDGWPIDVDPTSHQSLASQVVIDVDQLSNPFELGWIPGVAGHVEVDGKQAAPARFVVVVGLPLVRNIAGFIRWQEERLPVVAKNADGPVTKRECGCVPRV